MTIKKLEALHDFFIQHYTPVDIRRLARVCSEHGEISASLPGGTASYDELVLVAVDAFVRHGAIGAYFWQHLRKSRPNLTTKISALQALFDQPPAPESQLRLLISRVHTPHFSPCVEVEVVLHNESPTPRVIKELQVTARNLRVDYKADVSFSGVLDQGKLQIAVINKGWSILRFAGELSLQYGRLVETRRISLPAIGSGERMVFWEDGTRKWEVGMRIHGEFVNLATHEIIEVHEDTTVLDSSLFGGPHMPPDTTYVCVLDADLTEQQKTYPTIRTIAAGQFDVFQCAVTATKAARFDLCVEIVATDGTRLSVEHPSLHIWRGSYKPYEHHLLEDGSIFLLGPDGVWRLHNPTGARWREIE